MSNIIKNAIMTPDGTLLVSNHVHDYVDHTDANGEYYFTDGGRDYIRRSANVTPDMCRDVYITDDHEIVREHVVWGTYGKSGTGPLKYVKLCDMDLDHILAVLKNCLLYKAYKVAFKNEIQYRINNNL